MMAGSMRMVRGELPAAPQQKKPTINVAANVNDHLSNQHKLHVVTPSSCNNTQRCLLSVRNSEEEIHKSSLVHDF